MLLGVLACFSSFNSRKKKSCAPEDLETITVFAQLNRSLKVFLRSDNVSKETNKKNKLENVKRVYVKDLKSWWFSFFEVQKIKITIGVFAAKVRKTVLKLL